MGRRFLSTLVVAAHPDDEVIGAGIWMHRHSHSAIHILHITDGSPRDLENARALGFRSRRLYASARRRELDQALSHLAVRSCTQFEFVDKEAHLNLPALVDRLAGVIRQLEPDRVLAPTYEGGHPDHDAAAFAVAAVRKVRPSFEHLEYPLYHSSPRGRMIAGEFISPSLAAVEELLTLSAEERRLKRQMFACFETQQEILSRFRLKYERFRPAPHHDFDKPPHQGPLLYERWGWGITGGDWRRRARSALLHTSR